jgi:hypothetical protein
MPSEVLKYFIGGLLVGLWPFQAFLIMPRKKEQKSAMLLDFDSYLG